MLMFSVLETFTSCLSKLEKVMAPRGDGRPREGGGSVKGEGVGRGIGDQMGTLMRERKRENGKKIKDC